jgi:hypothetical protein
VLLKLLLFACKQSSWISDIGGPSATVMNNMLHHSQRMSRRLVVPDSDDKDVGTDLLADARKEVLAKFICCRNGSMKCSGDMTPNKK